MLSEQEICRIICSNPPACTCTDNCPINFTIETVHKACEAQHKADLEEIPKAILSHIKEQSPDCGCEFCEWLREQAKSMWGSGYDNGEYDTKEDFQKQKQEMWNEIVGRPIMISEGTNKCEDFKHKWGIE